MAAVAAASSMGGLGTLQTVDLSGFRLGFAASAPSTAPELAGARQAVRCLAQAVYFEAGFQPEEGHRDFPKTVCGVVYEGWKRRTGCQFSFVCDGSLWRRPPTHDELADAEQIAGDALGGYVMAAIGTATHYHSWRVDPSWNAALVKTA